MSEKKQGVLNGEVYTFITACGEFEVCVNENYLKKLEEQKLGRPEDYDAFDLFAQHKMAEYLHNPNGPAVRHIKENFMNFYINGKQLTQEEQDKLTHNYNFNNRFEKTVLDDSSNN